MDEKERFQKEFDESPHFPRDKSKYTDAGGKRIFFMAKKCDIITKEPSYIVQ